MNHNPEDLDILARTIFGEVRGELHKVGPAAFIAVANVVLNRVKLSDWFGGTVKDVCLKPYQFSCWNKFDPNRRVIESVTMQNDIFKTCYTVAQNVIEEKWPDITKGSDHYHDYTVHPRWADGIRPKVTIGRHIFYKLAP